MDCCGMPLAVRAGGGFVCRRCQAEYDVPVGTALNRAARCVEGVGAVLNPLPEVPINFHKTVVILDPGPPPAEVIVSAAVADHVEQVKSSGIGRLGRKGGPK